MTKKSLILNIASVVLCVCTIVIGVYSAKTVTVSMGGSLGFTSYGVEADINVYMYGHATSAGGDAITEATKKDLLTDTSKYPNGVIEVRQNNVSLTDIFGSQYFTNTNSETSEPSEIIILLNFTNKSKYDVLATVTSKTCTNASVKLSDNGPIIMGALNSTNATASIKITLTLEASSNGTYSNFSSAGISISVKLEKAPPYKLFGKVGTFASNYATGLDSAGEEMEPIEYTGTAPYRTYAQVFPYYVEMGEKNGDLIKWLVVGKIGTSGIVELDADDKTALDEGGMLMDENYVLLSEKVLEDCPFLESYSSSDETYTNTTYGTNANEYATSDIRAYLKNMGSSGFVETYNLTDSLDLISARSLQDLYTTDGNRTVPTSTTNSVVDTTADKFWLLSLSEVEDIFADDVVEQNNVVEGVLTQYYMSARTTGGTAMKTRWWFRTPGTRDYVYCERGMGDLTPNSADGRARTCLRPACIV